LSPEEFSDFYAASFRRLVGHLYAMTGDRAEAQDAVQEAFVRAWLHRGQLDRDGAPDAWVRATAWRIAVSRWHRARRGRLLLRAQGAPQVMEGPTPDRVAFIDALRKVPAEQRRALVLYYMRPERGPDRDRERGAGRHREGPPGPGPGRARAPPA
jgi:RNA polymerase sigma-70 factor, ECF subfamily